MKNLTVTIMALLISTVINAQEKQEKIVKEFKLSGKAAGTLWVDNINGNIVVEAQSSNILSLEISKYIRAKNDEELKSAWEELNPVFLNKGDTIEVYIGGFCECDCDNRKGHYWHQCDDEHHYDFNFDFKISVPEKINLWLSTINEGDITVEGVDGKLKIRNINGGISLKNVSENTDVHTINGDVMVKYAKNPVGNSSYYTLNGKLTVFFLKDLSADMSFKSFNGDFFTEFDYSEILPSQLVTSVDKDKGTKWTIEDKTAVRVGKGGILLDFETFNGDIYIRKL